MYNGDQKFTLKQKLRIETFLNEQENSKHFKDIKNFRIFRDRLFNFYCSYYQGGNSPSIYHFKIDENGVLIDLGEKYFNTDTSVKRLSDSFDRLIEIKRDELNQYFNNKVINNGTNDEVENFWIRVYLGSGSNWMDLALSRAYRDLNRTIHGMGSIDEKVKEVKFQVLKEKLGEIINETLIIPTFDEQISFDNAHMSTCKDLKALFADNFKEYNIHFSFGQAQKWINMTLKYLYALGENRYKGISKNFNYYHIPVDEIIQTKLLEKYNIPRLKDGKTDKWSRIDNYEKYLMYQESVRTHFINEIPLEVEFRHFNE